MINLDKCIVCAIGVLIAASGAACSYPKWITKRGPAPPPPVVTTVSADLDQVERAIRATFNDRVTLLEDVSHFKFKFGTGTRWNSFFLERKEVLSAHSYDFKLVDDQPDYNRWRSDEYFFYGHPAWFHCNFIIHVDALGTASTRIEIFEFSSEVRAGGRFSTNVHGPPSPYWGPDVREVEATTSDRQEVLRMIEDTLEGRAPN